MNHLKRNTRLILRMYRGNQLDINESVDAINEFYRRDALPKYFGLGMSVGGLIVVLLFKYLPYLS